MVFERPVPERATTLAYRLRAGESTTGYGKVVNLLPKSGIEHYSSSGNCSYKSEKLVGLKMRNIGLQKSDFCEKSINGALEDAIYAVERGTKGN